jgi:two-component system phosphate regulon sensor histidine kinase PhoR
MKIKRPYLFIAVSTVALLTVLIIQVNWIFQTARVKEQLFNDKANMVLSKTAGILATDKETCRKLESNGSDKAVRKVDSLFNYYMKFYNIHIDYYFRVGSDAGNIPASTFPNIGIAGQQACYTACVSQPRQGFKGLELKLVFPEKDHFIMAEMGSPFIASVILILVVLVMSVRTIIALIKEKRISEHTTEFLNNMTHEFKTPLTNIALAGKMMNKEQNIRNEEKIKHYTGIILQENEKLSHQVEQVLSLTALERGEIPLQKSTLDFHAIINAAISSMNMQVEQRQGKINARLEATNSMINGDKSHLTNAITNLIDNSLKYSAGAPEVEIYTKDDGDFLQVEITDNGIGIDAKFHEKVFESFFRVPKGNVHDVKGFGLGLSYTKKIVTLHGGEINMESEPGNGTTFTIRLPHA